MLVGVPPFNGESLQDTFDRIMQRQMLGWEDVRESLEPSAASLIEAML